MRRRPQFLLYCVGVGDADTTV